MKFSDLFYDVCSVTEAAAISCYDWVGKRDKISADQSAVDSMRRALHKLPISGEIVIGEGERDKAPMLFIGEKIEGGDLAVDIAVDPLEGTNLCAYNRENAISVLAIGPKSSLLKAPDVYMKKIAIGVVSDKQIIDINLSIEENIKNLASFKNCRPDKLKAVVLRRKRHEEIIEKLRILGVAVKLIDDGDILAVIATTTQEADIYIGIGGAPEGVIAAAALKCLGGQMQCQLIFDNQDQIDRANNFGIQDHKKIYHINDMVKDDVIFCASGVTAGNFLDAVKKNNNAMQVNSFVSCYSQEKKSKIISWQNCDRVSR